MSVLASVAFVVDAVEPVFVRLLFHVPLMSGVLGFKNLVVHVGAKLYDEPVDSTEDGDDDDDDDNEGNSDGDVGVGGGISVKK